ncbi:MAG: hypothetical protein IPJ01_10475 [Micavibrio sp.]|nr:hypothetical protein [Micavibrio sp.]
MTDTEEKIELLSDIFSVKNTEGKEESLIQWINSKDIEIWHFEFAMDAFAKKQSMEFTEWTNDNCVRFSTGLWQYGKDFSTKHTTEEIYKIFLELKWNQNKII